MGLAMGLFFRCLLGPHYSIFP